MVIIITKSKKQRETEERQQYLRREESRLSGVYNSFRADADGQHITSQKYWEERKEFDKFAAETKATLNDSGFKSHHD